MPSWSAAGGGRNSEKRSGGSSLGGDAARFTAQGSPGFDVYVCCLSWKRVKLFVLFRAISLLYLRVCTLDGGG